MFTAALLTITKTRKQPKHLSIDEGINKMWYIHVMEYYWALKRMKQSRQPHTRTFWQNIILSEVMVRKTSII